MKIYTVCTEEADELADAWSTMWNVCFSTLEKAIEAVNEELRDRRIDWDEEFKPLPTQPEWQMSNHRTDCYILDDTEATGYIWTVMGADVD